MTDIHQKQNDPTEERMYNVAFAVNYDSFCVKNNFKVFAGSTVEQSLSH